MERVRGLGARGLGSEKPTATPVGREAVEIRWAGILAGGDGTRLRAFTRQLAGDDRPKQFCRILDGATLLDQTRRRVERSVRADKTLIVVTRAHEEYYAPLMRELGPGALVVQPENRGTAPAILYTLERLRLVAPEASVAFFPSDHYVADDDRFMAHVDAAFVAVAARPGRIVLLGVEPDRPETTYGWIEPGAAEPGRRDATPVFTVRGFWEKPPRRIAAQLQANGCLWNSFVMVSRVATLWAALERTVPELLRAFVPLHRFLGSALEASIACAVYTGLSSTDFSRRVLTESVGHLAVLPVRGVAWNDLGEPGRVIETRRAVASRLAALA